MFEQVLNVDDIPSSHDELSEIMDSAMFTDQERIQFLQKVRALISDKGIMLDSLR